jgi:hypothetical protein
MVSVTDCPFLQPELAFFYSVTPELKLLLLRLNLVNAFPTSYAIRIEFRADICVLARLVPKYRASLLSHLFGALLLVHDMVGIKHTGSCIV